MTLDDILNGIPYKTLLELREARVRRLDDEEKKRKEFEKNTRSLSIQNNILRQ